MTKQVTVVKGGTRVANQETEVLRVVDSAPALMDGSTKPVINNQSGNFADLAAVTTAYNALLAALRTRGVIGGS
ncbi:hypothetical protein [Streptomyces sp. RKAG337]|uniref:hypothetical protein n=1 Tax=Streptomyces sp. RKAG337 TaxID=2893404 RepID=UPI0020335C0C|nr:hypothetical protein [Streptomyces sp. RKAG337]MCM2427381.1 hypothetical protein [Streptomyces sp. RKAG337]